MNSHIKKILLFVALFLCALLVCGKSFSQPAIPDSIKLRDQPTIPTEPLSLCGKSLPGSLLFKDRLADALGFLTSNPTRTAVACERLSEVDFYFSRLLKEKGLHSDFKFVIPTESRGDPRAQSWAKARGLFQFMQGTGREYGLLMERVKAGNKLITVLDERCSPESFSAGANYLADLMKDFGNDPFLALAAYNGGPGTIRGATSSQNNRDFFTLFLTKETQDYVYYILAYKLVYENPGAYNIPFSPRPALCFSWEKYRGPQIPMVEFFLKHNIPLDEIRWNQHFCTGKLRPGGLIFRSSPCNNTPSL